MAEIPRGKRNCKACGVPVEIHTGPTGSRHLHSSFVFDFTSTPVMNNSKDIDFETEYNDVDDTEGRENGVTSKETANQFSPVKQRLYEGLAAVEQENELMLKELKLQEATE